MQPYRPSRGQPAAWSQRHLIAVLCATVTVALVLIAGLAFAIWTALAEPSAPQPDGLPPVDDHLAIRDRIAADPMPSTDPQAAFTPDTAVLPAGEILVPVPAIEAGPVGVPSGFPHTAEGAVGQLAAIEKTVLEAMSLPIVREVHSQWVQPGGPALADWELTRNVTAFLEAARQPGQDKDPATLVRVTPAAALVKGADGPDWVVVCVLLDVQALIRTESRMGYGLCARMAWADGRWQIAPGEPPAPAPQAWPGSTAAVESGWLDWVEEVGE